MEQELCLNSGLRKNKKGIVVSLDAMISIVIAALLLSVAYSNIVPRDTASQTAMTRFGGDFVSVLDSQNLLDSQNTTLVEEWMDDLLPKNYGMNVTIECDGDSASAGSPVPEGKQIGSGKIFFVKEGFPTNDYCEARYWIWQN